MWVTSASENLTKCDVDYARVKKISFVFLRWVISCSERLHENNSLPLFFLLLHPLTVVHLVSRKVTVKWIKKLWGELLFAGKIRTHKVETPVSKVKQLISRSWKGNDCNCSVFFLIGIKTLSWKKINVQQRKWFLKAEWTMEAIQVTLQQYLIYILKNTCLNTFKRLMVDKISQIYRVVSEPSWTLPQKFHNDK